MDPQVHKWKLKVLVIKNLTNYSPAKFTIKIEYVMQKEQWDLSA